MKKERMKILSLVEEGKITVDEAAKLLEALPKAKEYDGISHEDIEEKINDFAKSVECFANDVSHKLGDAYKNMEPKLRTATMSVVEKTAKITDEISKSLHESLKNISDGNEKCYCEGKIDCECSELRETGFATPKDDDKPVEN